MSNNLFGGLAGRFGGKSGTGVTGSPAAIAVGANCTGISGVSSAGGTVTITPLGPNQLASPTPLVITLIAGQSIDLDVWQVGMLSGPTSIAFSAGVDSWLVTWTLPVVG